MKKRTLISKLRERSASQREIGEGALALVLGGIKTMTQDKDGKVIVVEGDTIEY